jgi:hypothetical protein
MLLSTPSSPIARKSCYIRMPSSICWQKLDKT